MFAVGRLGSYISRGVYTVSSPFQPFGGAVDIIVVEQQDGSFKSTPWYVRFGKFQGVLKANERVVGINVNGVEADFHMYLDNKGEAFFLREVDAAEGEGESESGSYSLSGDEAEVNSELWRTQKSMSCNYDANRTEMVSELEGSNRKSLTRANSRRQRILGLPIGRRSMKENGFHDGEAGVEADRVSSLERAEIAADLLEVRWTTNLRTGKNQSAGFSDKNKLDSSVSFEKKVASGRPECLQPVSSDAELSGSISQEFILEETYMRADLTSVRSNGSDCYNSNDQNSPSSFSEVPKSSSELSQRVGNEKLIGSDASDEATSNNRSDTQENMSKFDTGEATSLNTAEGHLTDEVCAPQNTIPDIAVKRELVEEVPFEDSSTAEPCKIVTGLTNKLSSEDLCAGASNLYLPPIENESLIANARISPLSLNAQDCIGDPTLERNNKVAPSDNAKEQFSFSDLDDPNSEHIQATSSGSEECLSQGSLENREHEVSELSDDSHQVKLKPTQDNLLINHPSLRMNLNRVSSPITILQDHNDFGEESLPPVAESLPNMLLDGDDLSVNVPHPLGCSLDSTLEAFKMMGNDVPVASGLGGGQQQVAQSQFTTDSSQISQEIKKIISDPAVEVSLCRHLLSEGMGYEAATHAFDAEKLDIENFLSFGGEILENDKLVVRIGGLYFPWDAALPIASAIGSQGQEEQILEPKGMIAVGQVELRTSEGGTQKSVNSKNGSWKIWPFSFKRSNSMQDRNPSSETAPENPKQMVGNTDAVVPKVPKKKVRVKFPTSDNLASLELKEGKNVVTFTFSTAKFGEQQVEARIFLWKWNARIVISDVDGTITKSDVLGQFMPLMGIDWSHTGVTHLFSAIKENGYQLLFLSARSILQAYQTRQFLFNLKQDGKALPEGPILISPDGLFPSLYREVIRRAPHEFKIACLEDVKVLFPLDHNPFYAGFGNRNTDELSYLKVGIPKGKIFTINPKGQVVVNRRVDSKSYTSLHTLVHDMFPPTTLHEQEDYNSWNFWRLPPPDALI